MSNPEARFDKRQVQAAWRLFDEAHPPCASAGLIYLLEESAGRLLLDGGESLYPGGLYIGPLAGSPSAESGLAIRGIQISTPATSPRRLCRTQIPVVTAPGSRTRLLAGRIGQCASPLPWPGALLDLHLDTAASWTLPDGHRARVIVIKGALQDGCTPVAAGGEHAIDGAATLHAGCRSHALIWLEG
ncbi:hypothetical protein [Jeongeupia sp. USM3]|uniref:hypothetical protein n=1 Tax=Jeongeupia sp. USM3 TaxID=1906741 RepID=UPI00089DFEFA|nr:hypothetical protein [Jeongeupia sp. USM3]AOX99240.1 hypothetical protein BJP62_01485 [Jeongeupia sp. USM3]